MHLPISRVSTALSAFLAWLAIPAAVAQQVSMVPTPIQQLRAPETIRWDLTIQYRDDRETRTLEEARKGPRMVSARIEKDKSVFRVVRRYSDSKQEEFWVTPNIQFHRPSPSAQVTRLLPGDGSSMDFSESDFPELYWAVGKDARQVRVEGRLFLLVESEASALPLTRREQKDADRMAEFFRIFGNGSKPMVTNDPVQGVFRLYLNPETRLPVRFESPQALYFYRFSSFTGLRNSIPQDFGIAMNAWQKEFSEASRPPSGPKVRNRRNSQ